MKVAILAGGFGTRISEETSIRPKPMVEVGGMPILWHVMKIYAAHGLNDFVILGGYKVDFIRNWLMSLHHTSSDFEINFATGEVRYLKSGVEPWKVTILDTGLNSMTGGRIRRAKEVLGNETFCLTYGDGVCDVNISDLIAFHKAQGRKATVTATLPEGRFGVLGLSETGEQVTSFREKDSKDVGLINGGFFVLEPSVIDLIDGDDSVFEQEPLNKLVHEDQLSAYRHLGFWKAMDTLRDRQVLEGMWASGKAPWKVWKD